MTIGKRRMLMLLLGTLLLSIAPSSTMAFTAGATPRPFQRQSTGPFSSFPEVPRPYQGGYVDPELLNSVGPTRVLIIASGSLPPNEVAKYTISSRAAPSFKGFYIMVGVMPAEDVEQLASDPRILAILKDRKVQYPVSTAFPEVQSLMETTKFTLGKQESRRKSFAGGSETTLREAVNITGAQKAWETYNVNGTGVTIAVVDTGVDYGALSLGYWDVVARDSAGYPAAFDADGECMAFTNITLRSYSTDADEFIPTKDTDPCVYFLGKVYKFSELELTDPPSKWPWDMEVTGIVSQSGNYHFGLMFQYLFGYDLFPVLVVDSTTPGVYDTVYLDLSFDWAWIELGDWPPDFSFTDERPLTTTGWTVAARDFTDDGIYDLSAGSLGYFLDIWALSPNPNDKGLVLKPIDPKGDYVVFVNDWFGHGTSCASCAVGRESEHSSAGPGMAPGAKVMGVTALYLGDIIEAELWASGFDLIPGTEGERSVRGYGTVYGTWNYTGNHKADIISNSWGVSEWAPRLIGLPWYDVLTVLEDVLTVSGYLDPEYPGTVIVHAGGNGAAGYGTFTEPAYATLPIGVGASTSLNYTKQNLGFAGGGYDDIISWSARGPTPLGNVKPDVVNIGAFGWAAEPVWSGRGDGSEAFDLFGGTSMATALTGGASALVIQAYNQTYGVEPAPESTKAIVKSSAKDLGYDAFLQGSGRVDAFSAVELALNASGVTVTSTATWDNIRPRIEYAWSTSYTSLGQPLLFKAPLGPIRDVDWFAGAIPPGGSTKAQFTVQNPTTQPVTANVTPVVYEQIGNTITYSGETFKLPSDWQDQDWMWGNLTVMELASMPPETELTVISLAVSYEHFDQDMNYRWNYRWGLYILDWIDSNENGIVEIGEVHQLNHGENAGTTNEVRLSFPFSKIRGQPVIFVFQKGGLDPIPFEIHVSHYERSNWTWVETPTTILVAEFSSETFTANLTVPADTPQGVYEGQIKIDITSPYNKTIVVPVSLVVPVVLSTGDLAYDITPPPTMKLYDSYRFNGYFDWMWGYESGDWKQWILDVQDSNVVAAFVSANWTRNMTDIDMLGINPMGVIVDEAVSPHLKEGCFEWDTRTKTTQEYVVLDTSILSNTLTGIYTVLLHNVLLNGTAFPETVTGRVELIKLAPRRLVSVTTRSGQSVRQNYTITTGRRLTNVAMLTSYPLTPFPVEITPPTVSELEAMNFTEFGVRVDVPEDTSEGEYPVIVYFTSSELPFQVYVLINVTVDNTSPTIGIVWPEEGAVLREAVTVEAYASDPSGIEKVEFEVGTTSTVIAFNNDTGHWAGRLDTRKLSDGINSIKVKAVDKAGNTAEKTVAVVVDNIPPSVRITSPRDEAELSGNVNITFAAADANLKQVQLIIDDSMYDVTFRTEFNWNTTKVGDGPHTIKLIAYDEASNMAETSVTVTTINTRLAVEATRRLYIAISAPIGLIIGIAVAWVMLKRKRAPAPAPQPASSAPPYSLKV